MALNSYKVLGQMSTGTYETLPITNISVTSNVATITTAVDHGLTDGDLVDINSTTVTALNIRVPVSTVPTTSTFTFPVTAGDTSSSQSAAYVNLYKNGLGEYVTNKEKTGGIATLTSNVDHGLHPGDWVTVDINDNNFDGEYTVRTTPTTTTFTYVKVGADVTSAAVSSGAYAAQQAIDLYTPGAGKSAVCSTLSVSNVFDHTGYFSAYTVVNGDSTTSPLDKALVVNKIVVDPGETYSLTMGYTLGTGESLVVKGSHAGMNFNLYGTELSQRR